MLPVLLIVLLNKIVEPSKVKASKIVYKVWTDCIDTYANILTKPPKDRPCSLEDMVHELHLLVPLRDIVLVHTDGIYPYHQWLFKVSQPYETLPKVLADPDLLVIQFNLFRSWLAALFVRESREFGLQ